MSISSPEDKNLSKNNLEENLNEKNKEKHLTVDKVSEQENISKQNEQARNNNIFDRYVPIAIFYNYQHLYPV